MISLSLAQQLRQAGLVWKPALNDFFTVPDRGLDKHLFVLSDLLANIEKLQGEPVIAFQGAPEWALDYLVAAEVVWMPAESQLRIELERRLVYEGAPTLQLISIPGGYRCEIRLEGRQLAFEDAEASEAYGQALLHLLKLT